MSVRVDTNSLIAGAVVCGDRGLGLLGSDILAATDEGTDGAGVLYNDVLPGDESKEFRALITTWPSGTFMMDESGAFTYEGEASTAAYQLYVDGQPFSTPALITLYQVSTEPAVNIVPGASSLGVTLTDGSVAVATVVQADASGLGSSVMDASVIVAQLAQGEPSGLGTSVLNGLVIALPVIEAEASNLGLSDQVFDAPALPVVIVAQPSDLGLSASEAQLFVLSESLAVYRAEYGPESIDERIPVTRFNKQPGEIRRVDLSFRNYLLSTGDSPTSGTAQVTLSPEAQIVSWLHQAGLISVWVSGGLDGQRCPGTARIDTTGGERLELDFELRIRDK